MWTLSDWHKLQKAKRPTLNNFSSFLFILFLGLAIFYSNSMWLVGCLFTLLFYFTYPPAISFLNKIWFQLGLLMSWTLNPLFLSLIYLLIFLPFGFLIKKKLHKSDGNWVAKEKQCRFDKTF